MPNCSINNKNKFYSWLITEMIIIEWNECPKVKNIYDCYISLFEKECFQLSISL